jgi:hypothetical protein
MNTTPAYTIEQRDGYFVLTHKKTGNTAEVYCRNGNWLARNFTSPKPLTAKQRASWQARMVDWYYFTQIKKQL